MIKHERLEDGKYLVLEEYIYYSKRYNKDVTVPEGYISDGASGPAEDIESDAWFVHDVLCDTYRFDDGSYCSRWKSTCIMYDILWSEKRYFRSVSWFPFVLLKGWIRGKF